MTASDTVGVAAPAPASAPGDAEAYPTWRLAWFAVLVFCLAQIISVMDRGILSLIVDPVRRDLGISEVQISLLQGFAFSLFYVTVGIPLGFVADRVSRRRLLLVGAVVWSLATIAGGLSQGFASMFVTRLLVGLGEATLGPCAVSMLSDMFPPSRRSWPMSVYLFGGSTASGVASLITGSILNISPQALSVVPVIGGLTPWRFAFVGCGSLGIILALLLLLIHDPKRRGVEVAAPDTSQLSRSLAYFGKNWKVFAPFFLSVGAFSTATNSVAQWAPTSLIRGFGMSAAEVGQQFGLAKIVAAAIGSVVAGVLVSALVRRAGIRGKLLAAPLIPLCALPSSLSIFVSHQVVAMITFAEIIVILPIFGAAMLSTAVELVPGSMKGVSIALYTFVTIVVGATVGPLLVAAATEHVFRDPHLVGLSLLIVVAPALIISSLCLLACRLNLATAARNDSALASALGAQ